MVIKNKYLWLPIILLNACVLPFDKHMYSVPMNIINVYNESIYLSPDQNTYINEDNGIVHHYVDKLDFLKEEHINIFQGYQYAIGEQKIYFYQDKNRKCLLFSISNNDLINMEREFVKSNKNQQSVFIIEENGIRIISQAEYEQMKPTLAPHKFDSSLCK